MGAVDVGVGHQDDLVVAELGDVELLEPDAGAQRRDQEADLLVREHLVVARLLGVDDLAAQRQDRLGPAVAALLGRPAGGVALDQEELARRRVALRAVGQLAGQVVVVEPLLPGELARLARGLAGLGRVHALLGDLPRGGGSSSKAWASLSLTTDSTRPRTSLLPSLALVWPSNWGSGRRTEMTAVRPSRTSSPRDRALEGLEEAVGLGVGADRPGERRAEAGEVGAALARVDVVGEGEDDLLVAVVVLERDLDLDVAPARPRSRAPWGASASCSGSGTPRTAGCRPSRRR